MGHQKKPLLIILGIIALVADLLTLGQFILSGIAVDFWSSRWILGILFTVFLMGAGFSLLILGGGEESTEKILPIFGGIYGLLSILFYTGFGYLILKEGIKFSEFSGFLLLFSIMSGISISCIAYLSTKHLRILSYGFAGANVIYVLLLVYKYIFAAEKFYFFTFIGEVILLVVGAALFMSLYFISEEDKRGSGALKTLSDKYS